MYYCPKVFGGWVKKRKKPTLKIVNYRRALTHRLDGTWEWSCPVWFNKGMFADAVITSAKQLNTESEAREDMKTVMGRFGATDKEAMR